MIHIEKLLDPQEDPNPEVEPSEIVTLEDGTKIVQPIALPSIGVTLKTFKNKEKKDV